MEEITPPANQPSAVEFDIVKLREQMWITGLVIMIELSYVFIIYLPHVYLYCLWGFIVYLISSLFLLKKDIEIFHRFSVYGLLLFNTWYIYGLLPWGEISSMSIMKAIIQLLTIAVSIFYVLTRNEAFITAHIGLLCFPVSISFQLSSSELGIITVSYFASWYLLTGLAFYLNKDIELVFIYVAVLPILRTVNILFVLYIIILCVTTAVKLYPLETVKEETIKEEEEPINVVEEVEEPLPPPPPVPPVIRPYRPYRDIAYKAPKPKPPQPVEINKNLKVKSIYGKNENDKV